MSDIACMFVCSGWLILPVYNSERVGAIVPCPIFYHPIGTDILDTVIINFCQLGSHCNLQVWASNYTKVMISHPKTPSVQKRRGQVK